MIQDILTGKIERNVYVNEENSVSDIQILINQTFLLFSQHEIRILFYKVPLSFTCEDIVTDIIANEQAERRREACEAASLMPREVLQQAEKILDRCVKSVM